MDNRQQINWNEEQGPCFCPNAIMAYPHTLGEHWRNSCNSATPCGGCDECIAMQFFYYERKAGRHTSCMDLLLANNHKWNDTKETQSND